MGGISGAADSLGLVSSRVSGCLPLFVEHLPKCVAPDAT